MANLPETTNYDAGVYQIEVEDPVQGGAEGISNKPLKNLANRTAWLKKRIEDVVGGLVELAGYAKTDGPSFTGSPTSTTQPLGDNSTKIATDAFVQGTVGGRLAKSVAGGSTVTLTAVEAGNAILDLSGILTANIAVVVPTAPTRAWLVKNGTTGAYTLTIKTASGTGVVIPQGYVLNVFTDGTNVCATDLSSAFVVDQDAETGAANIPFGSTAQRPANGQGKFRFNTTLGRFEGNNGSTWGSLGGATGGGSDAVFYLNDQTINNDYTVPSGQNAMSAGPITIASGKTVTVSDGSVWTVV